MEQKLDNGARVMINPARWADVLLLKNAIFKEIGKSNIDGLDLDIKKTLDADISLILPVIMQVMSSEEIERAVFRCLKSCTYDDVKITESLFEDNHETRDVYYEIIFLCLKENLSPLFKSLRSQLSVLTKSPNEGRKRK